MYKPDDRDSFGRFIQQQLQERGWSQKEFARQSGLTDDYVCKLHKGIIKEPRRRTLDKILKVLNLTEEELWKQISRIDKANSIAKPEPIGNIRTEHENVETESKLIAQENVESYLSLQQSANLRESICSPPSCALPRFERKVIGREEEIQKILDLLAKDRPYIIVIDGLGGIGKTALVVEVAYRCQEAKITERASKEFPQFDAIIYTSAKESRLTANGIEPTLQRESNLGSIFQKIANTLKDESISRVNPVQQVGRIYESLSRQKTLLIVDNLETMSAEEQMQVMSFLHELPHPTKAIVTTRDFFVSLAPIRLEQLEQRYAIQLLQEFLENYSEVQLLNDNDYCKIYELYGGIPLVLEYLAGQMASGCSIKSIVNPETPLPQDFSKYFFEKSMSSIRNTVSYKLFITASIFRTAPDRQTLVTVSGQRNAEEEDFQRLDKLSLMRCSKGRYRINGLTRRYAGQELNNDLIYKSDVIERWVRFYLDLAQRHGGLDWEDWHIKYKPLDKEWGNLMSLVYHCVVENQYDNVLLLWNQINHFADLYGYWVDRIKCLDWLIIQSEQRGDLETYALSLARKAWTLTMTGQDEDLIQANSLLEKAWLRQENLCEESQGYILHNMAVLFIRKHDFTKAKDALNQKKRVLDNLCIESHGKSRGYINWLRSTAKLKWLENQEYQESKDLYGQVYTNSSEIGWSRMAVYAQYCISELELDRGNLDAAETLILKWLPEAVRMENRRRTAYFEKLQARLEIIHKNFDKAKDCLESARSKFQLLGMSKETKEITSMFENFL